MKKSILLILIVLCFVHCKKETPSVPELNTQERIAQAYGIDQWKNVEKLAFTFNVDRDTLHMERSWIWDVKADSVTLITSTDTISYQRGGSLDSISEAADKGFINDTYWLLAPFKLVWDEGFTVDTIMKDVAPISKDSLQKLSIVYGDLGGYTPGDGYDFFYDDSYILKEWTYRKGNTTDVCMTTTWEELQAEGGIRFGTMHQNENGSFKLYFTGIDVSMTPEEPSASE